VPRDAEFERRDFVEGRFLSRAPAISSPSQNVLERTEAHFGVEFPFKRVIFNPGVVVDDGSAWDRQGHDPQQILFVGRFDRHKGGDLVIRAFRDIARLHPKARLVFVGPDRGLRLESGGRVSLSDYVAEHLPDAARARVDYRGPLPGPEVAALRRTSAVTIVASRDEIFGMTVVEALACGCPLVAAKVGGIPELVEEGVTGLLFDGGSAEHLARRVGELLAAPELAAALGAAGRRWHDARLSTEVVAREMADFYAEVVDRAPQSRSGLRRIVGQVAERLRR
jgi:glycosyltransferase involved in cell wall biosynthesis